MVARKCKIFQDILLHSFPDTTIISIVDGTKSIVRFDRILVLSDGRVAEYGTPFELLQNPNSHLATLYNDSNLY